MTKKKPVSMECVALRPFRARPHNEDDCISVAVGEVVNLSIADAVHICRIGKASGDADQVAAAKKKKKPAAKA